MKLYALWALIAFVCVVTAAGSVNPDQGATTPRPDAPNLGYAKLLELQHMFYQRWVYPNNLIEAASINSTIFSENVQGRVSDTRNFEGRELNTEYIFGLFVPSNERVSVIGTPNDYEIIQFAANQNIASASTRVNFTFKSFGNLSMPVVIDTWMTWNEKDEITQYDVVFRWFGYLLQTLIMHGKGTMEQNVKTATAGIAQSICKTHTKYCQGPNAQYSSEGECFKFLTQDIRLGAGHELGMNTLLCRNIHESMIRTRPEHHCPHIGPSGGGQCDDSIPYEVKAGEQYFTNSRWIPTQA